MVVPPWTMDTVRVVEEYSCIGVTWAGRSCNFMIGGATVIRGLHVDTIVVEFGVSSGPSGLRAHEVSYGEFPLLA